MLQRSLILALFLCSSFLIGCEDNPTGPEFEPFELKGTVPHMGTDISGFDITDTTTVLVEVTEITGAVDTVDSLGFSLGSFNDTGNCIASFRDNTVVGSKFSFRLAEGNYCFLMFDNGSIPADTEVAYTLFVDP